MQSQTGPQRAGSLLRPKGWPLRAYLDHCDGLLTKDIGARILAAMADSPRAQPCEIAPDWTAAPLTESARVCILVNADLLNRAAFVNVARARVLADSMGEAYLFGVTEFMPGAYRDFICCAGADDCLTTQDVLDALQGAARA